MGQLVWQNLQFTGGAEFALTFGNFKVKMTVPDDHIIGATGECRNYNQVLSAAQYKKWQQAQSVQQPLEIVTLDEAVANEKDKATGKKNMDIRGAECERFCLDSFPQICMGCHAGSGGR